jgi:hypothetical protein
MLSSRVLTCCPRAARVRPALAAQPVVPAAGRDRMRAPWSGAARPRVGFASTSPTTRPLRADGRVPGGRIGVESVRMRWVGEMGDGLAAWERWMR